jgi:hypothetical protein
VPRATAGCGKKVIAAAYACVRGLRSQKQKDADQQTCCKCPEPNVQAEITRTRLRRSCGISWD